MTEVHSIGFKTGRATVPTQAELTVVLIVAVVDVVTLIGTGTRRETAGTTSAGQGERKELERVVVFLINNCFNVFIYKCI